MKKVKRNSRCISCELEKAQAGKQITEGLTPEQLRALRTHNTPEGLELYRRLVPQVMRNVSNNNEFYNVPQNISTNNANCISGVCKPLKDMGILDHIIYSNTEFAKNSKKYGFSGALTDYKKMKPGDIVQYKDEGNEQGHGVPSHAQVFLGKNSKGEYEFFDNYWGSHIGTGYQGIRTRTEDEMKDWFDPKSIAEKVPGTAQYFSPDSSLLNNPPLDPNDEFKTQNNVDSFTDVNYSLNPNLVEYYKETPDKLKFRNDLLALMNDKELDKKLQKSLSVDSSTLQRLKQLSYGIAGQESNFDNPQSFGASLKYMLENLGSKMNILSDKSMGPYQTKIGNISDNIIKDFDINGTKSFNDLTKSYAMVLDVLNSNKKYYDNRTEQGKLEDLRDIDPYYGSLYAYNSPQNLVKLQNGYYNSYNLSDKERAKKPNGDIGSYPSKVKYIIDNELRSNYNMESDLNQLPTVIVSNDPNIKKLQASKEEKKQEYYTFDNVPQEPSAYRQQGGTVSNTGYLPDSPDRFNDYKGKQVMLELHNGEKYFGYLEDFLDDHLIIN